jgi:hypothetical protein
MLYLADLFNDPTNEFILDDPWDDPEDNPPECWWWRILTPEESATVVWR